MNTYFIPRNTKGESKILYIFSIKALIYTAVGGILGVVLFLFFSMLNLNIVGIVCIVILALLGFVLGTVKIPDSNAFEITRKAGGLSIDEIIVRYFKFKLNKQKIYVYKQGGTKDDE